MIYGSQVGVTRILFAGALLAPAVLADNTASAAQSLGPNARPVAGAMRIEAASAPIIDADLSDSAWAGATVIDQLRQREPDPGAPATERTVLRVMYDANNIYFSVYAYDSAPGEIAVRTIARDGRIDTGDSITIMLDPGLTRRNAYAFTVGPTGARGDSLLLNNAEELDEWDAIWNARARRVADGWVAEVAIPFRSLSYDSAGSDWGFEFSRDIRHKNEEVRWSSTNPALEGSDISQSGTLTGITNIEPGIGLDVQVYGKIGARNDWHLPGSDTGLDGTFGGNAFYKITPALTGTLTINPDFSDAPLDLRQVNTSRFSLFFPETRDFFLHDAASFEFGGQSFAGENRDTNNGRPFFSRNIGLVNGAPVSIIAGGKLSGEYGGFNIGALSVLTDRTPFTDQQVLSTLRVTRPVLAESRLGFILTHGDPTGASENSIAGLDFQYRNSNFLGDAVLIADAFYQRSFSNLWGDDDSFGTSVSFPNEPWIGDIGFKEIGRNFDPALGFVNRTAIRLYEAQADYRFRFQGSFLRNIDIGTENKVFTDLHDRLESRENEFGIDFQTRADDELEISVTNYFENIPEPFDLPNNIFVLPRKYQWTNIGLQFESSDARPLAIEAEISCCSFYNGQAVEAAVSVSYRPNAFFEFVPGWEGSFIDLPQGSVDIHVVTVDSVVNFTPEMQLAVQAQFDNISRDLGFLARYRWEYQPGSELFVALGQSAVLPRSRFVVQTTQFSVRLGHTFRF
ncbi:MAG: hypothetical protein EXR00_05290 [Alphaproteobacteria bacterium]|nr:hypothetical protein [Alphaproteobacteria bacterium]